MSKKIEDHLSEIKAMIRDRNYDVSWNEFDDFFAMMSESDRAEYDNEEHYKKFWEMGFRQGYDKAKKVVLETTALD